jgi:hypothetical protein
MVGRIIAAQPRPRTTSAKVRVPTGNASFLLERKLELSGPVLLASVAGIIRNAILSNPYLQVACAALLDDNVGRVAMKIIEGVQ